MKWLTHNHTVPGYPRARGNPMGSYRLGKSRTQPNSEHLTLTPNHHKPNKSAAVLPCTHWVCNKSVNQNI